MSMLEGYLRHGRRYGVDAEFWQAAASDLDGVDLRALARHLGVKLPTSGRRTLTAVSGLCRAAGAAARTVPDP